MATPTTRLRQKRRGPPQGAPFLFILLIAVAAVLWLEGVQVRRFSGLFSYIHQTTKDLAGSLDFPPDHWAKQQQQSNYSLPQTSLTRFAFPSKYQQPQEPQVVPAWFNPNVNVPELMLQEVSKHFNQSTCVCPELMAASKFVSEARDLPEKYNISVMQLVGTFKLGNGKQYRDNTTLVRDRIFESNQALLQKQGISVHALTRRPTYTTGMATPNFWKMEAMLEECNEGGRDLVWFLDSDIVLQETVAIDVLWAYHAHMTRQHSGVELDMLLAKDWRGIYTGSVIVNCKSPTAMRFLQEWKDEALENLVLDWKQIPGHMYYIEANVIHELNSLRWLLNLPNWIRYPFRQPRNKTEDAIAVSYLNTRVHSTLTPCAFATYNSMLYCEAKDNPEPFEGPNQVNTPLWYEPGHQAIHISSDIENRLRRNEMLLESVPSNLDHVAANVSSLKESANIYIQNHANKPTINPLEQMAMKRCMNEVKAARHRLKIWRKSFRGPG